MSELADSNISLVNNVFIKEIRFRHAGDRSITHAHVYDHQTLLSTGAVALTVDGQTTRYEAPAIIVIVAGKHHGFIALADETVAYCIHAVQDGLPLDAAAPLVIGMSNSAVHQVTLGEV